MDIEDIIAAIRNNQVRITDHADEESHADGLTFDEVCNSIEHGEIIEDYADDWPYLSCLIYGRTVSGSHIHSVWAYNELSQWAVLITVCRPDQAHWIDWRERRRDS